MKSHSISISQRFPRLFFARKFFIPSVLPFLVGIYPPLFLYAENASIVLFSSFSKILGLYIGIIAIVFLTSLHISKFDSFQAAIASSVFLLFFNTYGIVFRILYKLDFVRIEHLTLFPLVLLIAYYCILLLYKLKKEISISIWKLFTIVFLGLTTFNIAKILPIEIRKNNKNLSTEFSNEISEITIDNSFPDIYYIILDEFSGFKPMREYFNYQDIDKFKQFLNINGFYVIENSESYSTATTLEIASRLNFQQYACCDQTEYLEAIRNNKVASYLKKKGYAIIAFEQMRDSFPTATPFTADYIFESDPNTFNGSSKFFDDYIVMVTDNTFFNIFEESYKLKINDPYLKKHMNMIYFTIEKIGKLEEIHQPKFVYVHLLLPHSPFMFDKNGNVIDPSYQNNWNYYLGNYIYAIKVAENIITNIFSSADPNHPPVIILQSDHGIRNNIKEDNENTLLSNFPEEYKHSILFALNLPHYEYDTIPQDIDPINTFPIIFNFLFNENFPIK